MSIYTRTGDKGTTSIVGGKRLLKSNLRIETYGVIDELSSFVGLAIAKMTEKKDQQLLTQVQITLYNIMGSLAGAKNNPSSLNKEIEIFEKYIDEQENKLKKLKSFILPQGTKISCLLHITRTVCRRAERNLVRYDKQSFFIPYLNRLSDLFFILARKYNKDCEIMIESV